MTCSILKQNETRWDIFLITEVIIMGKFMTIITIILAIICIPVLLYDICLILSWSKAKEKAFIANLSSIIVTAFCAAVIIIIDLIEKKGIDLFTIVFIILEILLLPFDITCLSPEGIRTPIFVNNGISPVQNWSYEYTGGTLTKEKLDLFRNNQKFKRGFHLGIKKPKTVKILADWYGKHGYENPLTK